MKRRSDLLPAELKNGRYVKPVALLEPEQVWCGRREVWTARHGWAGRYHVMVDRGMAACRPDRANTWHSRKAILICDDTLMPIAQVPSHMCCLRNGCRQFFEAYLA